MNTFVEIEDRVRKHSSPEINEKIEADIERSIRKYSERTKQEIDLRIQELEKEWSVERALEATSSSLILGGLTLGAFTNRRFLIIPGLFASFLLHHSIQGWSPPVPLLRSFGYRTRKEIDWEKYALKALKGDFDILDPTDDGGDPDIRAMKALTAVQI